MEHLNVFYTVESLKARLKSTNSDKTIGLIPTMGALHSGHLELIKIAQTRSDIVVVSIFVNPTQFNRAEDLENYPRSLEEDIKMINSLGDIIVFAPHVHEMYPVNFVPFKMDIGEIANVMEGEFRPGHFEGVTMVVKRLFDIVNPQCAFFGEKDIQQLVIIQRMVQSAGIPVQIVGCKTVREETGLAMSSRNKRLTEEQKEEALIIYNTILFAQNNWQNYSPDALKKCAIELFTKSVADLEYIEIVDPNTLLEIDEWVPGARICLAANFGPVRLIDNDVINE